MPDRTFTILPAPRAVTCVACGVQVSWRYVADDFPCPACGCGLRLRGRYFRLSYLVAILITAGLGYAAGMRDERLFAVIVLALWPTYIAVVALNIRLFPPEVEISGEFRSILYPGPPQDPSRPPDAIVLGAPRPALHGESSGETTELFRLTDAPRTLEGTAIWVGAALCVLSIAYIALEPIIYKAVPTFRATRRGPTNFPITIRIQDTGLHVTNNSSEEWWCGIALAPRRVFGAFLSIDARSARVISYREFRRTTDRVPDTLDARHLAARREVHIECTERSGITHIWTFY